MTDFGVTVAGFVIKPFTQILNDKLDLARSLFGPDVDLRSSSALRKVLDVASTEDLELWKALEAGFYANFVSTATGGALDLLGDDLGLQREFRLATGQVTFTLSGEAPGRNYVLPVGTLVETAAPVLRFRTTESATLSGAQKKAIVAASAGEPGPAGNVLQNAIVQINPIYASHYLSLGSASVTATNDAPFTGGDEPADDETYRARLLRLPRTLFTVEAVSAAALDVDGVRDCIVSDPLGGVDVSLSKFNSFVFDRRRFGQARFLGSPYFFDVMVAPQPGYTWETIGNTPGLRDAVAAAVDAVRPIGIFPNIRLADAVIVGVRANVTTRPGLDAAGLDTALKQAFERRVAGLGLGGAVLASEVLRDFMTVPGVVDVQNLHLRRYPPTFGTIVFGDREQFQGAFIEADLGANLSLTSNEIATFRYDSRLIDLEVSDR
jgi:uncharacterized phage protein gp47/JayE